MRKAFKLEPPLMPNFICYEAQAGKRQDGFNANKNTIPISELSEQEAIEYGELMKQTFIEHWQRKVKPIPPAPPEDRVRHAFKQTTPLPPK
jgi:hypothetical protein